MAVRTMVVVCALFWGMCISTSSRRPEITHAYCKIVWLLGLQCDQVNSAIVTQIRTMSSYKLGPVTSSLIQAKHTSAVGQSESVNFTLRATFTGHGCHVEGSSVSASWYSLFDNGTNYCNLYNIIQGSGLSKAPGFTEFTNEWLCLGYKRSMCN